MDQAVYSGQAGSDIAALLKEIEERKAVEAELRQANEELEELYTNTECGYHSLDAMGTVVRMNDIELFWLGYRREEVIGKMKLTQFLPPGCHDDFKHTFEFLREHGWVRQFQCDMLRKDGSTFPIIANVRAIEDEKGQFLRSSAAIFDISERKQAEAALKESEERYALAVQGSNAGIWDWNPRTGVDYLSPRWKELLGFEEQELSNRKESFFTRIHPDDVEYAHEALSLHLEERKPYQAELRLRHKSGDYLWFLCRGQAQWDASGSPVRMAGSITDITDRKRAETELQRLNEMLEQRVSERTAELVMINNILETEIEEHKLAESLATDFSNRLQDMTHRFVDVQEAVKRRLASELHDKVSSNLTAIGLNLGLIEKQLPEEVANRVIGRLYRTLALVEETIVSAREISGNLRPAVLDFAGLLAAVDDYSRQFQSRTAIAVEVMGTDMGMRLRPEKEIGLFRIVQEALTNCGKHSDSHRISIELTGDAERTVLTIADDGVGFDLATLEHPTLGLLSMRERAEAIGGTFRLESLPGKGTRITVEA